MIQSLDALLEEWTLSGYRPSSSASSSADPMDAGGDETFQSLFEQLKYHSSKSYCRYIPALYPPLNANFLERLLRWLNNSGVTPEQQRLMFEVATRIAYFSFEDFLQLYRSAYVSQVTRWIVDELRLKLNSANFSETVMKERQDHTWYCPVTDSMVISEFYHANRIMGIDQRPAFRSLIQFGDPARLKQYMQSKSLRRLVLLEDFVGTGSQSADSLRWAVRNLDCPVIFVPLIICPDGLARLNSIPSEFDLGDRLRIEPVMCTDASAFVQHASGNAGAFFADISGVAKAIHPSVAGAPDKTYGPFGYHNPADQLFGSLIVLFSNTPDNTLPMIHHHASGGSQWQALFPRVSREI